MKFKQMPGRAARAVVGLACGAACILAGAAEEPTGAPSPGSPLSVKPMLEAMCIEGVPDKLMPPIDGMSRGRLCACAADRLAGNVAMQPLLEGMSRGQLQPSASRGPFAAQMMGAVMVCAGQAVEQMGANGQLPLTAGVPAWGAYFGKEADPLPADPPAALAAVAASQAAGTYRRAAIKLDKGCQPAYPKYAANADATGTTRLALFIDSAGKVAKVRVNDSSGETVGHKQLDLAAMAALASCPFKAATLDGRPVGSWITVEYVWRLE